MHLAEGDLTARVGLQRSDELGALARSFDHMAEMVERRTEELRAQRQLADLARQEAESARARVSEQLQTIEEQQSLISEMSVPILPLAERTLVMPLVGTLDSGRMLQAQERALEEVQRSGARNLILDITGVPVVDTAVAQGLIQIVQAGRLLGARVVLAGIGPEVAQAIVGLGISLGDITTQGTLRGAVTDTLSRSAS
jgi:rsbT co-antagonist protein RsbR